MKRPIWRVPLVLGGLGILCRLLHYAGGFLWGLYLLSTGSHTLSTGPVPAVLAVLSFLLFWLAGWRFVRGLSRREIVRSATIMTVVYALLLALEQITQAAGVGYPAVYRLYALAEAKSWVDQLLFRLTGQASVLTALPGLFAPYLYLVFAKRADP